MALQLGIDHGSIATRRIAVDSRKGTVVTLAPSSRPSQVVLAAPAAGLTFRALSFPFADRRRLEAMVATELEHSLAFPPNEAVWDFVARPPVEHGDNVYAVACPRETLAQVLTGAGDVTPTVVDAEAFAYVRVLAIAGVRNALTVDFGATHSTFCSIREGHLEYVRVLLSGGNDLDTRLAEQRHVSATAARTARDERGIELTEVRDFFERLLNHALLPTEPPETPIYVTGGLGQCKGLLEWLGKRLARAALPMPVPAPLDPFTDVVAYGMALWGTQGGAGVNLHQQSARQPIATRIAVLIAIMLVLLSADVVLHRIILAREIAQCNTAIRVIAKQAVPDANLGSLSELESVAQERQGKQGKGHDMEAILLGTSKALKAAEKRAGSTDVHILDLSVSVAGLRLRGDAGDYPVIEALKKALATRFNSDVNLSTNNVGNRKGFEMSLTAP